MPNQFFSPEGDLENYFVTEYWLIDQYVGDTLWTWGGNGSGRLGDNTTTTRSTPVTTLAGGANWKQSDCGLNASAAVKIDGTLWLWGQGNAALGNNTTNGSLTPVTTFAGGTNWKQVSVGGQNFAAAIKTDGTLWTWGENSNIETGINIRTFFIVTPVTTFAGGSNWKQVSSGFQHVAAIKTDGTLWVWGNNSSGQLGTADTIPKSTPVTTFAGGTNWKQVDSGFTHTAAVKTDGTLWAWGNNSYQAVGVRADGNRLTPVTTFAGGTNWKQVAGGVNHTAAVKTDGTLWTWGRGTALGDNALSTRSTPVTTFTGGTNWKQVSCGSFHMAAIKTDGTLWTWGDNSNGQLGDNTVTWRYFPVTTFAGGTNWKQIACSSNYTLAVTSGTDPTFFIS